MTTLQLNRSPLGLPKGCGLNGRTLNQKSALFIRRNRDFGDVLLLGRGVFLRFRGSGAALRGVTGRIRVTRNTGLAGYRFTLARKTAACASIASKGRPLQAIVTTRSQLDWSG